MLNYQQTLSRKPIYVGHDNMAIGMAMKMGLRNLRRRPSRTLLTGGMLAISTLLVVFSTGMSEGSYAQLTELATESWIGHFQVQAPEYEESPSLFETVNTPKEVIQTLQTRPDVVAVASRVEFAGMLSAGKRTSGTLLHGVDPILEPQVTTIAKGIK